MRFIFGIILSILIFANPAFGFETIIEEGKKIQVERKFGERDILVLQSIEVKSNAERAIANRLRKKIKALLINQDNIAPILEEDLSGFSPGKAFSYNELHNKNVSYALSGELLSIGESCNLKLAIWDTYKNTKIMEQSFFFYQTQEENFTKQLVTQIYEFLTGEFGFFYGKLMYTTTARPGVMPFKKVVISSRAGDEISATAFTDGEEITFNPRYCAARKEVFFTSQKPRRRSQILIANRETGEVRALMKKELVQSGKTFFSPSISKDCKRVALSVAENGSTNIYVFNRVDGSMTLLTKGSKSINTAPSFFDNDNKIVFVSDSTGKPKIWSMDANGQNKKRISLNDGAYFAPSVSRDGSKLAFIKVLSGKFFLGISNLDGSKEEILHSAYLIEDPTWSPIGKTILFSMKNSAKSQSRIYAISLNGGGPKVLDALSGSLNEPSWINEF